MRAYQCEEVGQARWRPPDIGGPKGQSDHSRFKDNQRSSSRQSRRGSEQPSNPTAQGGVRQFPSAAVVVVDQVGAIDSEPLDDRLVGQVEHLEVVDGGRADPAEHFERIDSLVEKVPEQLRPCGLLLVRGAYQPPGRRGGGSAPR